ncbi:beta-ketoacyl-ACP synthase 3 [Massilia sp. Se16.2.3]|uniref:beta-ketoacyl-ACP synthase 3 n=1 Tax=Massilia sp. Se16.2.3 TaxID=2709303 RepID=UPI0015FF0B1E|nr:beta-ketoacyl-ACP synthase 3 [Massilia sp. Se16.2.3]QNA98231.1 beta-ketoacyl-ACP synthase 3 [Massilia sp. Se16.2.3]
MSNSFISGIGLCLPHNVMNNAAMEQRMNTTEAFILERTGVITRRHVSPGETTRDLMVPAVQRALASAGIGADEVGFLIVNTLSPDHHDPSQACLIQAELGLGHTPAVDIRAQCSGFLYGLRLAHGLLQGGQYRNVVVVCGEVLSKRMDCSDAGRNLAILLGDGAAAAVVQGGAALDRGIIDLELGADGHYFDLLMTAAPGTAGERFLSPADIDAGRTEFVMRGRPMFEHASGTLVRIARAMLARHRLGIRDIDHVICHQPNLRILDEVQLRLEIPAEKLHLTVDQLGNMASASMPATLAMNWDRIASGELVLMLTYGSGATWGAALYRKP